MLNLVAQLLQTHIAHRKIRSFPYQPMQTSGQAKEIID